MSDKFVFALVMVAVMAAVTYAIRVTPFVFFRKKITSRFVKSFLYYVPYSVLIAMTFPSVLTVTGNVITSVVGTAVAIIASLNKKSMMVIVAILAVLSILVAEGILTLI